MLELSFRQTNLESHRVDKMQRLLVAVDLKQVAGTTLHGLQSDPGNLINDTQNSAQVPEIHHFKIQGIQEFYT